MIVNLTTAASVWVLLSCVTYTNSLKHLKQLKKPFLYSQENKLRKYFDISAVKQDKKVKPSSSYVEGDKQMDQPKSQTSAECCHTCTGIFFDFVTKYNSLPLEQKQP